MASGGPVHEQATSNIVPGAACASHGHRRVPRPELALLEDRPLACRDAAEATVELEDSWNVPPNAMEATSPA